MKNVNGASLVLACLLSVVAPARAQLSSDAMGRLKAVIRRSLTPAQLRRIVTSDSHLPSPNQNVIVVDVVGGQFPSDPDTLTYAEVRADKIVIHYATIERAEGFMAEVRAPTGKSPVRLRWFTEKIGKASFPSSNFDIIEGVETGKHILADLRVVPAPRSPAPRDMTEAYKAARVSEKDVVSAIFQVDQDIQQEIQDARMKAAVESLTRAAARAPDPEPAASSARIPGSR